MLPYFYIFNRNFSTYGAMMALAYLTAGFGSWIRGRKRCVLGADILIVAAVILAGALVGGNLFYCLVSYSPHQLIAMISVGDFSFLRGGLVFYGGLIGGILGAFLGVRISGTSTEKIERVMIPMIPLGHAVGRVGCLLAGCCYGMKYTGPLAVYYPASVAGISPTQGCFPIQPVESIINLAICGLLIWLEKKLTRQYDLLIAYLGMYAFSRFFLEFLRGDGARGLWFGLSSSQWVALVFIILCPVALFLRRKKKI